MKEYITKPLPDQKQPQDVYLGYQLNRPLLVGFFCADRGHFEAFESETHPRFNKLPTSVSDILNGLEGRYGVNEDRPFLSTSDSMFSGALRHIVPLSYDEEGGHWSKRPSSALTQRLKPQSNRKYLHPAKGWQKRLETYSAPALVDKSPEGVVLKEQLQDEGKVYHRHTQPCMSTLRGCPPASRPDEWSFGFLMGEGYVAIDCDCENDEESAQILTLFLRHFPGSPIRSRGGSRWASILFVVDARDATADTFKKWTVSLCAKFTTVWTGETAEMMPPIAEVGEEYGDAYLIETPTCKKYVCEWGDQDKDKCGELEVFGYGRQLVFHGWHPSDNAYTWYGGTFASIQNTTKKALLAFVSIIDVQYGQCTSFDCEIRECPETVAIVRTPAPVWNGETLSFFIGKNKGFFSYLSSVCEGGLADAIRDSDLFLSEDSEKIYLVCPNEAAHSCDTGEKQTCFFKDGKHFHCLHASCRDLTQAFFASHFPHDSGENVVTRLYKANCFAISTPKDEEPYVSELLAKNATYSIILRDQDFCGILFRHDNFTNADTYHITKRRSESAFIGYPDEGRITDEVTHEIAVLLSYLGIKRDIRLKTLRETVHAICMSNSYDSVIDTVNALPAWDGVERISGFFETYMENVSKRTEEDVDWLAKCARYLFTSLMARMLCVDGVQADISLILQGAQGQRKSTLARILAGSRERFGTYDFSMPSIERARSLVGKTVVEIPELIGMSRRDANEIKSVLTKTEDKYRKMFSEDEKTCVRRNIFIFTTNDSTFLTDATGDRRFALVNVGWNNESFLISDIERDYTQLMAEAKILYEKKGVMWQDVDAMTDKRNAPAREEDPWQSIFSERLDGVTWASAQWISDIVTKTLGIEIKNYSGVEWRRAKNCTRTAGFIVKVLSDPDGKTRKVYARKDTENEAIRQDMARGQDVGIFNGYLITDNDVVVSKDAKPKIPRPVISIPDKIEFER